MTKEQVIAMAREAGIDAFACTHDELERFATLVGNAKLEEAAHPQASEPVALKERSTNPLATQNQVELTDKASEPAGWKLVPVEPTDAMIEAGGFECAPFKSAHQVGKGVWDAMLAAAPEATK